MTDTLALMAAGFMHAISPINLLAMLASTIVGITIGCLWPCCCPSPSAWIRPRA